jgi:feruloyl esterase
MKTQAMLMLFSAIACSAATCESLTNVKLSDAAIVTAQVIAAGEYNPPTEGGRRGRGPNFKELPSFCKVTATLRPSSDSDITMELWLPTSGWNGDFQGLTSPGSNGALEGAIEPAGLADPLRRSFAVAASDNGHKGATMSYAIDRPEKLVDYGYRAVHEMTLKAKAIITAFYGSAPKHSYWVACAAGGRYGLSEAQRYPGDYDGIVVGAPPNDWTHLMTWSLWMYQLTHKNPLADMPEGKYTLLHKAAIEACDAADGLKDGVIEDPRKCKFNPNALLCKGQDSPDCLTSPQVEAARKMYSPLLNPRTKAMIFPGFVPGSELQWPGLSRGDTETRYVTETFRYLAFKDPKWSYWSRPVDYDKDVAALDASVGNIVNAVNPDLSAYFKRGGKLIEWTGWSDGLIPSLDAVNYFTKAAQVAGGTDKISSSFQLYMVPGVQHCRGGEGTDSFDLLSPMREWVESGTAPRGVIASHNAGGKVSRTRPICPYPQVAKYTGSGSIDEAQNFACSAP